MHSDTAAQQADLNMPQKTRESVSNSSSAKRKTMHDGIVYDLDFEERRSESIARTKALRDEIGTDKVTGYDHRLLYRIGKRTFDIAFSAAVLIFFSWLFVIIAISIKIDDPKGPVIFRQVRVGKNGSTFTMHKFRSMCADAEDRLNPLKSSMRKAVPYLKWQRTPELHV